MPKLGKKYDHKLVESPEFYQQWVDAGYFHAGEEGKPAYTIVIPPPNVTGKLHLGHAWDTTLQDILSRYKRLQGYDVLWLPGMDHAGIATQAKIEARLAEEGTNRYELGREKFLDRAWAWKEEYADTIRKQWAKLGLGLDYSRERFTLDEGLSKAVQKVFTDLYDQGLIYQGKRIINWDPQVQTALSNIEVEHKEIPGKMYYIKYPIEGEDETIVIATTRPETMFADQAIFVHPEDERYQHLIGKKAINPANGEPLPIMADDYIDREFGTAIMKCTPAHDPNDFELALKYGLEMPITINTDGTMNELAGKYAGMDRFEAREAFINDLIETDQIDHIEEHPHMVGHSQRSGVIVEPYLSNQWFVKMKPLAQAVLDAQKTDQKISFVPERFTRTFEQWLENIEDWCISRQLWWGHRIPAWTNEETGEQLVQIESPGEGWVQDEDVLDTWFSSALWPFSTLGWPMEDNELERYFPTDVLVTGYDIIFFWVARMAFQTRRFMNNRPFKEVLIHGLIRDNQGRKMSKSLGNGIDPMDVIEADGADALRLFLTTNSAPGMDLRFDESKLESSWNFINKLWNAARYVEFQIENNGLEESLNDTPLSDVDQWILYRLDQCVKQVSKNMDRYEFSLAGNELFSFVWDDFCSWYIELSKIAINGEDQAKKENTIFILHQVLDEILILLSPFIPFVSDYIYRSLPHKMESINLESWPQERYAGFKAAAAKVDTALEIITALREIKQTLGLKNRDMMQVSLSDENQKPLDLPASLIHVIEAMAHVEISENLEQAQISPISSGFILYAADQKKDLGKEREELLAKIAKVDAEIARAQKMLSNPGFVNKAPAQKVEAEKEKLERYQAQAESLKRNLDELDLLLSKQA